MRAWREGKVHKLFQELSKISPADEIAIYRFSRLFALSAYDEISDNFRSPPRSSNPLDVLGLVLEQIEFQVDPPPPPSDPVKGRASRSSAYALPIISLSIKI